LAKPVNSTIVQYILLWRAVRTSYFFLALVFFVNACAMEGNNLTQASDIQRLESKPIVDQFSKKKLSSHEGKSKPMKPAPESTEIESTEIESKLFLNESNDQPASPEIEFANFRKRLLGLDAEEVMGLLGVPAFRRYEPPAEIWQYRTLVCVVDVFLYQSEGNFGVEYVETRGRDKTEVDEKACFGSVLNKILPSSRSRKQSNLLEERILIDSRSRLDYG